MIKRTAIVLSCLLAVVVSMGASPPTDMQADVISPVALYTETGLSHVERRIRQAAVKVHTGLGHGSGSYLLIDGFHIVLTAQHVAEGPVGSVYTIQTPLDEHVAGRLVYADEQLDVAAILISPLKTRRPMEFRPLTKMSEVGTVTAYAGYPSDFSMLSFRGMISGYEWVKKNTVHAIILNSYGWFGCSGSAVYDMEGSLVGILWGVSVEPMWAQVQEDLLYLTPSHLIKKKKIIKGICVDSVPHPSRCNKL